MHVSNVEIEEHPQQYSKNESSLTSGSHCLQGHYNPKSEALSELTRVCLFFRCPVVPPLPLTMG